MGVILWLCAMAAALGVDVSAAIRNALTPVSSRRIAVVQALPVVGIALVQAVAVGLALLVARTSIASTVSFALVTLLAAVCFSLIAYALRLAFGGVGVAVFVLFLLLQVAALGNVVPLETAPSPLRAINGLLPLTAFTNGTSQLVSGGDVGSLLSVVLVLAVWAAGAFGATVMLVKRRRLLRAPLTVAAVGLQDGGVKARTSWTTWALLAAVLVAQCVLLVWHHGHGSTQPHEVPLVVQGPPVVSQAAADRLNRLPGEPGRGPGRQRGLTTRARACATDRRSRRSSSTWASRRTSSTSRRSTTRR